MYKDGRSENNIYGRCGAAARRRKDGQTKVEAATDEFCTRRSDIENELTRDVRCFRGKLAYRG